jgi:hypothetical protein
MKTPKTQSQIIAVLTDLLRREHVEGCDSFTCDINAAYGAGFEQWAIELFSGSGASSPRFDKLYDQLGPKFKRDARNEGKSMGEEIPHERCIHCSAIVWDPECCDYSCDSCGADDCRQASVVFGTPIDRGRVGIHLLNPTDSELERAKETAAAQGFRRIFVYRESEDPVKTRRAQFKLIVGGVA